jgi:hypothetical protein
MVTKPRFVSLYYITIGLLYGEIFQNCGGCSGG